MSRVGSRQSRADGSGDAQTKLLRGGGTVVSAQFLASVTKSQDAVVLSATEVARMKNQAVIVTADEALRRKAAAEAEKEHQMAESRARKLKMQLLEDERRAKAPELSDLEREELEAGRQLLAGAQKQRNEAKDAVKFMNQMVMYAKCVAIRDKQLEEKKAIEKHAIEEAKKLDTMMEVNRLKKIAELEEIEARKIVEMRKGREVIEEQIKYREKERLREQELREQEAQAMLARIREMEIKKIEDEKLKVIAGKKMLEEIMQSNQKTADLKLERIQASKDEDQKIKDYILAKVRREEERDAELARIKAAKDAEFERTRAQQEKALDTRAALDELRAKRANEAAERKFRAIEKEKAEKLAATQAALMKSRTAMLEDKERRMIELAREERRIFEQIIVKQREAELAEKAKVDALKAMRIQGRDEISRQIKEHEDFKFSQRYNKFDEGKAIAIAQERELAELERIKMEKIEELARAGVPEKYRVELMNKKFAVT